MLKTLLEKRKNQNTDLPHPEHKKPKHAPASTTKNQETLLLSIDNPDEVTTEFMVEAQIASNPSALTSITQLLQNSSLQTLLTIEKQSPRFIVHITTVAQHGHPEILHAILAELKKLTVADLIAVEKKANHTIRNIADTALKGHPQALNAIAPALNELDISQLYEIEECAPDTIAAIAKAASIGHFQALNAIAPIIAELSTLKFLELIIDTPGTFQNIIKSSIQGHPQALKACAINLENLNEEEVFEIEFHSPRTIFLIVKAAVKNPTALFALCNQLHKLNLEQWQKMEKKAPGTQKAFSTIMAAYIMKYKTAHIRAKPEKRTSHTMIRNRNTANNPAPTKSILPPKHPGRTHTRQSQVYTETAHKITTRTRNSNICHETNRNPQAKTQKISVATQPKASQVIAAHTIFNPDDHRYQPNPIANPASAVAPQANTTQEHNNNTASDRQSHPQDKINQRPTPAQNTQQVEAPRCLIS